MSERQGDVEPDVAAPQTDQPADGSAVRAESTDAGTGVTDALDEPTDDAGDMAAGGDAAHEDANQDGGEALPQVDAEPVAEAQPVEAEPTGDEPVDAEPVEGEPVEGEPAVAPQPAVPSWTPPVYSWPKPAWRSELAPEADGGTADEPADAAGNAAPSDGSGADGAGGDDTPGDAGPVPTESGVDAEETEADAEEVAADRETEALPEEPEELEELEEPGEAAGREGDPGQEPVVAADVEDWPESERASGETQVEADPMVEEDSEPTAYEPIAYEPRAFVPVAGAAVAEDTVAQAPVTDDVVGDEPTAEEPTAEETTAEETTAEATLPEPDADVPDVPAVPAPGARSLWAPPGADDISLTAPVAPARSIWAPPAPPGADAATTETSVLPRVPAAEPPTRISALATEDATVVLPRVDATPASGDGVGDRTTPDVAGSTVQSLPAQADTRERGRRHDARSTGDHDADHERDHAREPRRRRWVIAGIVCAVLVVLGGLYVGALWLWADRVPPGTTVAGVEIGGQQADTAVATLEEGLASAAADPLPVGVADKTTTLDPAAAGLTFDPQATVDSVTGFGLEPARLWRQLFGAGSVEPISTVDRDALATAIEGVTEELSTPYVDGTLAFVEGEVQVTPPADGLTLDVPAAVDVVASGWLTQARPLELPTVVDPAVIGQAELDRAVTQLARPLAEGPITVAVGGQTPELPVDVLTGAASFVPEGDQLALQMDGQLLAEAVLARTTNLLTAASDATFAFTNGAPTIVPGVPGTMIDPEDIAAAVAEAATSDRTAEVELVETDPAESTAELEALGITQVVSEFSTPLTSEPRRTKNITNGASKINGMLIRPGEEFNLGDALGPLDAEHGYVQAGAIVNGEHTDAWGGGLSQMSTTTYNAAYFAGFELVEHHPHSEWFSRYPEGRESTIFTPEINMRWKNNTPYGALLQSWVEGGRVWVRIWSTPYWTVESSTSGRSNVRHPTTVYSQSPTCEPQSAGNPGFTVTVTRRVLLNGEEQSTESWTVTYKPQNAIVCGAPPG